MSRHSRSLGRQEKPITKAEHLLLLMGDNTRYAVKIIVWRRW
jgi:hypothetical protein